ncbi:FAD:protein FMN transferase [Neolewinella persica]|uniref:FAD:protein FMN transferase n=1 Tax=Neolewinella persica TaxID=70998 RepID=UPI000377F15F|nr:FAD:protein FMN transferase [Neolewinella persica]
MIRHLLFSLLFMPLLICAQVTSHETLLLMGSRFDITTVGAGAGAEEGYNAMAIAEIQRIERLISSWDPNSQTSAINAAAGDHPVKVDAELFGLIQRALGLSRLTDGAFDISYASMDRLWRFDGSMKAMPEADNIAASVARVGFDKIVLDEAKRTVFLPEAGMKIGFGAIGKGYAADRARQLLEKAGCKAGIINASGDLTAWGRQPSGEDWKVAITNPLNKEKAFAWLPVNGRAIVTSGNYEKFVRFNGTRYAHIIDPRTGYPSTGIISVTVLAPSTELADALATSVFVMGVDTGLDFINQIPNVDCIIVDEDNHLHTSGSIDLQTTYQHD